MGQNRFIALVPGERVEPGQVEFSEGKPCQVPGIQRGANHAAAVRHVVQEAPWWVSTVDVQYVGKAVLPFALDGIIVRLKIGKFRY